MTKPETVDLAELRTELDYALMAADAEAYFADEYKEKYEQQKLINADYVHLLKVQRGLLESNKRQISALQSFKQSVLDEMPWDDSNGKTEGMFMDWLKQYHEMKRKVTVLEAEAVINTRTAAEIIEDCAKVCGETEIVELDDVYRHDDAESTLQKAAQRIRAISPIAKEEK